MQMTVCLCLDVLDNVLELDASSCCSKGAAVDQHVNRISARVETQQETVAESLPVHAHTHYGLFGGHFQAPLRCRAANGSEGSSFSAVPKYVDITPTFATEILNS